MNNKDRIRLAEAMGWTRLDEGNLWRHPDGSMLPLRCEPPDPDSSADDDYAVLEWMRKMAMDSPEKYRLDFYAHAMRGMMCWNYRKGYYARAALQVLDSESENKRGDSDGGR